MTTFQWRGKRDARQVVARRVVPVDREDLLQLEDTRAFQFEMRIAPPPKVQVLAEVLISDVHPAGEGNLAIDDHDLAVTTQIDRPPFA